MRGHALVIGINKYEDRDHIQSLRYAVKDAKRVYEFFIKCDFEVETLFDHEASEKAIRQKLKYFSEVLLHGDVFLFYFSGHGYQPNVEDKIQYLLPYDADYWVLEKNETTGVIPVRFIEKSTNLVKGVRRAIVLDACRSNLSPHKGLNVDNPHYSAKDVLAVVKSAPKDSPIVVVCSCSPFQKAYELEKLQGGIFTTAMLRVFEKCRKQGEPITFAGTINRVIAEEARKLLSEFHHSLDEYQSPWIEGNMEGVVLVDGTSEPPIRTETCPICGMRNPLNDTFRCKKCYQDYLCQRHWVREKQCCEECVNAEPPVISRHIVIGNTGCAPAKLCIVENKLIALLRNGNMMRLELPPIDFNPKRQGLCHTTNLMNRIIDWKGHLYAWRCDIIVAEYKRVLKVDVSSGNVENVLQLPSETLCLCMAKEGLWILGKNHTLYFWDLFSEEPMDYHLPETCLYNRLCSIMDSILAYGARKGGLWLLNLVGERDLETKCLVSGNVQMVTVADDGSGLFLVLGEEDHVLWISLLRIGINIPPERLIHEELPKGEVDTIFSFSDNFIIVTRAGIVYIRPYAPQLEMHLIYEVGEPILVSPTICKGILALTTTHDREQSKVTGVRMKPHGEKWEKSWDVLLPPIQVPAVSSGDHFYFADRYGKVHMIRSV